MSLELILRWLGNHFRSAWSGRWFANLAVVTALTLSFSALNFGLLLAQNFNRLSHSWGTQVEMNVYLSAESPTEEKILAELGTEPLVAAVQKISRDSAFQSLRALVPGLEADPELLQMIPTVLEVKFQEASDPERLKAELSSLAGRYKTREGVEAVEYGAGWLSRFEILGRVLKSLGAGFAVLVALGSLFMVSYILQNSIHQRREEIEIMELVGAGPGFIRGPFVIEGALLGLGAGALSLAFASLGFFELKGLLLEEEMFSNVAVRLQSFSGLHLAGLLFIYVTIGALTAALSVWRLNTGFAAAERLRGGAV